MIKRILPLAAALIALPLAACNKDKPEEVTSTSPDPMASKLANAPAVELPPSIKASKSLRCSDNSLLYVDFFSGDKQVNVRTKEDGTATTLKSETAGGPWTSGEDKLSGDENKGTYTHDGKSLTCHT